MAACAAVSAGNIRHILIANLGLGGEYADPEVQGTSQITRSAFPTHSGCGCARVAAAVRMPGSSPAPRRFFNQAQLIGVQV